MLLAQNRVQKLCLLTVLLKLIQLNDFLEAVLIVIEQVVTRFYKIAFS
jgi:hypothetical protein